MINQVLQLPFPDPPETYSTSDSLYEALDIPRTAAGTLPRAQRHRAGLEAERLEDLGETGRSRKAPAKATGKAEGRTRSAGSGSASAGTAGTAGDSGEPGEKVERTPRTPRQRSRTRTRGGAAVAGEDQPVGDSQPGNAGAAGTGGAGATSASSDPAGEPGAVEGDAPAKRRRRRGGRGGSGRSGAAEANDTNDTATTSD
jgi:hypothetical protein